METDSLLVILNNSKVFKNEITGRQNVQDVLKEELKKKISDICVSKVCRSNYANYSAIRKWLCIRRFWLQMTERKHGSNKEVVK